jgi:hypothetical protein
MLTSLEISSLQTFIDSKRGGRRCFVGEDNMVASLESRRARRRRLWPEAKVRLGSRSPTAYSPQTLCRDLIPGTLHTGVAGTFLQDLF